MELQVIRTIHPVGRGAFYSETLHRPGMSDDKHVVYDCGVLPFSKRLEEEIGNFLPEGSTVDVLFISHFHADHVNGLKLLTERYKIKHVVLPQIDGYEWFYIIENYLTTGIADVGIITDVQSSIGNSKVIQVAPRRENAEEFVADESLSLDGRVGTIINGLSPLTIDNHDFALWHYVVVNPVLIEDLEVLKTAIQNIVYNGRKVSIDDLHNQKPSEQTCKQCTRKYSRAGMSILCVCCQNCLTERITGPIHVFTGETTFVWNVSVLMVVIVMAGCIVVMQISCIAIRWTV